MSQNHPQRKHNSRNTGVFPTDDQLIRTITLPDGWQTTETNSGGTIGGYSVVAGLSYGGKEQGLLLADPEYQRIACVLYPNSESFRKYTVESSPTIASNDSLSDYLTTIEGELDNRNEKLQ